MPYSLSLTESTSKNFSTFLKAMAVLFPLGLVAMIMTYIHANNLWWFFGTVVFSALGIVYVFGWIFYRQRGYELDKIREENRDLRSMLMKGGVNINIPEQQQAPQQRQNTFPVQSEPSPRDKELTPAEYKKLKEIWEKEYGQTKSQIGYNVQAATPTPPEDRWGFNPHTGRYFRKNPG